MSPKTVEAYARDAGQFLGFLAEHLGGAPSLKQLAKLTPQDVRAFMAARRAQGISGRSLMRGLAGARSFARFLERNGKGKVGALSAVRAPKVAKTLPKPLAISAAKHISDVDLRAGEEREPWVIARDAAVLALLYGSGLRISEALGLKRKDVAKAPDVITVTGKGNKQRMVPVLPQVLPADRRLSRALPLRSGRRRSAVRRRPWRPAVAAHRATRHGAPCAARSACPTPRRRTRCGTPSPRISWRAAAICAPSRNCSVTPRCRPRRSIPRSMPSVCSKSIAAPIRAHRFAVPLAHGCNFDIKVPAPFCWCMICFRKRGSYFGIMHNPERAMSAHENLEHAEHAEHASHGGNKKIALLISVLALCLAFSETLGKSAQTTAISYNVDANDLWAFFQAKTIRITVLSTAADSCRSSRARAPMRRDQGARWPSRSRLAKDRRALRGRPEPRGRPQAVDGARQGS